jgi:DNA-binding GntR family transcriptional regulator
MIEWDRSPGLSRGPKELRHPDPDRPGGLSRTLKAHSNQLGSRAPVSGQMAESIRNMIVAGDLQPGDRIVESRIARQIGVGQLTVREALVALGHQGIVVRKADQGCVVISLTGAEICHLMRIRAELETLAVELALESASDTEIEKLLEVTGRMKEAASQKDPEQFFKLDFRFHDTLWKLSGNTFLPRLLEQTLAPLLAFLFIRNLRRNLELDVMGSAEAHAEVAKAILSRHKETARRVTQQEVQIFAGQDLAWHE